VAAIPTAPITNEKPGFVIASSAFVATFVTIFINYPFNIVIIECLTLSCYFCGFEDDFGVLIEFLDETELSLA
jgi:hypothetical protein